MNVDRLFTRADKLSSIDRPSLFVECESAVLNSLVAESGNFTKSNMRYILMVETVHQYPGIRTTELMKLLGLPNETFYSVLRKAAYEDHRIEWKSCRLYPISPV